MTFKRGYLQVYTGNGKGKTTCAVGLTIRASPSPEPQLAVDEGLTRRHDPKKLGSARLPALAALLSESYLYSRAGRAEAGLGGGMVVPSSGTSKTRSIVLRPEKYASSTTGLESGQLISMFDKDPPAVDVLIVDEAQHAETARNHRREARVLDDNRPARGKITN